MTVLALIPLGHSDLAFEADDGRWLSVASWLGEEPGVTPDLRTTIELLTDSEARARARYPRLQAFAELVRPDHVILLATDQNREGGDFAATDTKTLADTAREFLADYGGWDSPPTFDSWVLRARPVDVQAMINALNAHEKDLFGRARSAGKIVVVQGPATPALRLAVALAAGAASAAVGRRLQTVTIRAAAGGSGRSVAVDDPHALTGRIAKMVASCPAPGVLRSLRLRRDFAGIAALLPPTSTEAYRAAVAAANIDGQRLQAVQIPHSLSSTRADLAKVAGALQRPDGGDVARAMNAIARRTESVQLARALMALWELAQSIPQADRPHELLALRHAAAHWPAVGEEELLERVQAAEAELPGKRSGADAWGGLLESWDIPRIGIDAAGLLADAAISGLQSTFSEPELRGPTAIVIPLAAHGVQVGARVTDLRALADDVDQMSARDFFDKATLGFVDSLDRVRSRWPQLGVSRIILIGSDQSDAPGVADEHRSQDTYPLAERVAAKLKLRTMLAPTHPICRVLGHAHVAAHRVACDLADEQQIAVSVSTLIEGIAEAVLAIDQGGHPGIRGALTAALAQRTESTAAQVFIDRDRERELGLTRPAVVVQSAARAAGARATMHRLIARGRIDLLGSIEDPAGQDAARIATQLQLGVLPPPADLHALADSLEQAVGSHLDALRTLADEASTGTCDASVRIGARLALFSGADLVDRPHLDEYSETSDLMRASLLLRFGYEASVRVAAAAEDRDALHADWIDVQRSLREAPAGTQMRRLRRLSERLGEKTTHLKSGAKAVTVLNVAAHDDLVQDHAFFEAALSALTRVLSRPHEPPGGPGGRAFAVACHQRLVGRVRTSEPMAPINDLRRALTHLVARY